MNEFSLPANWEFSLEGCVYVDSKVIWLTRCISQGPPEIQNQKYVYVYVYRERDVF